MSASRSLPARRVRFAFLLASLAAALFTFSPPVSAAKRVECFPELAAMKDTLPPITLVGDGIVVIDVMGKIEDLAPVRSRAIAEEGLALFDSLLRARGYRVQRRVLGTIGGVLDPGMHFRLRDEASDGGSSDTSVVHAPLFVDSCLASPKALTAWQATLGQLGTCERKKGDPAEFSPNVMPVGDALSAPILGLVLVSSWEIHGFKKLFRGPLTGEQRATVAFAMFDTRTGQVLWYEWAMRNQATAKPKIVARLVKDVVRELP